MKKLYLYIFLFTVMIAIIGNQVYKPYVLSHQINDFGLAVYLPDLLKIMGICSFIWCVKSYPYKEKLKHIFFGVILLGPVWKFINYLISHQMDWKGVIAVGISGILTFFMAMVVEK